MDGGQLTEVVPVRMTPEMKARIDERAVKMMVTPSQMVRQIIAKAMDTDPRWGVITLDVGTEE